MKFNRSASIARRRKKIRQQVNLLRNNSVVKDVGGLNVDNLIELTLYDCNYKLNKENLDIIHSVLKELNIL